MCIISDTMQQTLQAGSTKKSKVTDTSNSTYGWRIEFWRSADAALHVGTPPKSEDPFVPMATGPQIIE